MQGLGQISQELAGQVMVPTGGWKYELKLTLV